MDYLFEMDRRFEEMKVTPTRYFMMVEDWQGCEVYGLEFPLNDFIYWPFGGHA